MPSYFCSKVRIPIRYIEASKARLYHSESQSCASVAQAVLLYVFENILKMLHPFMPFVTEELWQVNHYVMKSSFLELLSVFGICSLDVHSFQVVPPQEYYELSSLAENFA